MAETRRKFDRDFKEGAVRSARLPDQLQVRLMDRDDEPVVGLPALPFDLPPLIQRGGRPGALVPAPHAGGHPGEGAELIDDQQPGRERAGPGGPLADGDVTPRAVYDKSPNDLASSARRLVIEATYVL
jgi:hypothetical protein